MKKNPLLLAIAFMLMQGMAQANGISMQTAQTIAVNFFKLNAHVQARDITATLAFTQTESDGIVDFYVFNMAPAKGFVIVAANDNVQPVIAYSTEVTFNTNAAKCPLNDWIKGTSAKLHFATVNNIPGNTATAYKWTSYLNGQSPVNTKATGIGPLCATTWNQEPY